jgi:hypothetical protein
MPRPSLKAHLDQLRRELADAEQLDHDTRALLVEVAEDIDQILEETAPNYDSLRERIEAAAVRFEAEHPRFSGILGDITDTLAKLGL